MSEFRFANLSWLHATWLVLGLVIALVLLELRRRSVLDRMISPLMQRRLVLCVSTLRRFISIGVLAVTLLLLILALMRPQWGMKFQPTSRVDSQIMVCLDVSRSMLAEDAVPNRLERAKAELDSMLGLMDGQQQVGLTAFAGNASVMCPMTTDFGFLRMILSEVSPDSVGRGGTKIGEAIRKAVAGFRRTGDVNRMILLITDGEDHDSFPLDAAKEARERGIRVVCIGFGDEAGSKIEVTDPETGGRSYVTDRNGQEVVSRLDGETLRQIALETEGAYIPAGTGTLDLESIYDQYISAMLRETISSEDRAIRNEVYQWCVLAAVFLLFIGLLAGSPFTLKYQARKQTEPVSGSHPVVASALLVFLLVPYVQGAEKTNADNEGLNPRELYNKAIPYVNRDPDRAEKLLSRSRRDAGVDGELRFRCLYNLGWVAVSRADGLIKDEPKEALKHLQQAVNRFRESIRLRPDNMDARHNLEIVSRRILELSDQLAKQDPRNLAARLDELIKRQRTRIQELQALVERQTSSNNSAGLRREFRRQGVAQRQIISDMQKFADDGRRQVDAIKQSQQQKKKQPGASQQLRAAQLTSMLRYIDLSLQRMNKARSLTRRRQGTRSFVRWSAGLASAKRARDQLRSPIEVLSIITADAIELAQLTSAKAAANQASLTRKPASDVPPWLTSEFLQQSQDSITERTSELLSILSTSFQSRGGSAADQNPRTKRLLSQISKALPLIKKAKEAFVDAERFLQQKHFRSAYQQQSAAILALREAAEFFFDVRRLIEAIYRDQGDIQNTILSGKEQPKLVTRLVDAASQTQQKNSLRADRFDRLLDFEMNELGSTPANQPQAPNQPSADQLKAKRQRFEAAKQILAKVKKGMGNVKGELVQLSSSLPGDGSAKKETIDRGVESVTNQGKVTIERIEELRRLFFSLVEHLRETAQRQANLNDRVTEASGKRIQQSKLVGPLGNQQRQLQKIADQIAKGLLKQAGQSVAAGKKNAAKKKSQKKNSANASKEAESLRKAGKLVDEGQSRMAKASDVMGSLSSKPVDWTITSDHQRVALESLLKALALLDKRQQNQPRQDQNKQQKNQNQQKQKKKQGKRQQKLSASQMLQLIRDREAQRRKNRRRARVSGGGAVDKDW